jgi:hypothetical protein
MQTGTLIRAAIAAAALMGSLPTAIAEEGEVAYVARVTGAALVNKGDQYVDGTEGMPLSTGDRVMTLAQSEAAIQFKDGCQYLMKENELMTVPSMSPCVFTKGTGDRLSVTTLPPVPPAAPPIVPPVIPPAAGAGLAWIPAAAAGLVLLPVIFDDPDDDNPPLPPISQ